MKPPIYQPYPATRTAWLPWQAEEPTGPEALLHLAESGYQPALL